MKHLKTFESFVSEANLGSKFEFDYKRLVDHIKGGAGWIDPEYIEETWDNVADFGPYDDKVKDEVLARLADEDLLYHSKDNNPEEKGKKITKAEAKKLE